MLSNLNEKSFFPISRRNFLSLFLILATTQVSIILLGSQRFGSSSESIYNFRLILFVIGPLITLLCLFSFLNFLMYEETLRPTFKLIFEYSLIGGLVSILLALTLNSRAVLIQLAVLITINEDLAIFIGPAIFAPLVEELAKALPIYYLSRGLITKPNREVEFRVFNDIKTPVYVGAITGLIFNCLETYWYIWNGGYLFEIDDNELWKGVVLQIVIRSTNLLHILDASIIGLGIAFSMYYSKNKILTRDDFKYGLLGYLIAFGIHALWNGSLVLADENTPSIDIFGVDFPLFNLGLLMFSFFGLFAIWIFISTYSTVLCSFCEEWHIPPYDEYPHFSFQPITLGLYERIKNAIFRSRAAYSCPICKRVVGSGSCDFCGSKYAFNCRSCTVAIPAHATNCWNCGLNHESPFKDITMFPVTDSSIFAKPIVYIFTGFYLSASISILIILSRSVSSNDGQVSKISDQLMIIYLFLFMIGLTFLRIVRWLNDPFSYSLGYSLARTIFSMLIFQFAMLFIAIGIILMGVSEFIIVGVLFLIESIVIIHYGISIMFNFSPLFHQVDDKRLNQ